MTSELSHILSPDELDLDAKLRNYDRKILSMRAAAEAPTVKRAKLRVAADRSAAEDYRRAKQTQQRLQVASVAQAISLTLMVSFFLRSFLPILLVPIFVLGILGGALASLAKVQRCALSTEAGPGHLELNYQSCQIILAIVPPDKVP